MSISTIEIKAGTSGWHVRVIDTDNIPWSHYFTDESDMIRALAVQLIPSKGRRFGLATSIRQDAK